MNWTKIAYEYDLLVVAHAKACRDYHEVLRSNRTQDLYKTEVYKLSHAEWSNSERAVKDFIKSVIRDWLKAHDIGEETSIIFESTHFYENKPAFIIPCIGITNGVGNISDKRTVMNKVYVLTSGVVRTHKVRTDSKFMHPFEEKFADFIKELVQKLGILQHYPRYR